MREVAKKSLGWILLAAIVTAIGASVKLEIAFRDLHLGKETGFELFETTNLIAVLLLAASVLVFLVTAVAWVLSRILVRVSHPTK